MSFKMKGFSGFKSPLKQDDKKCYINKDGESVCPYVPLPEITEEQIQKEKEREDKNKKLKKDLKNKLKKK